MVLRLGKGGFVYPHLIADHFCCYACVSSERQLYRVQDRQKDVGTRMRSSQITSYPRKVDSEAGSPGAIRAGRLSAELGFEQP